MLTLVQIINALVIFLLPVTFMLSHWLVQSQVQRTPLQRQALAQFSMMAVRYVEEEYGSTLDKKALATACVIDLFQAHRLPVPPASVIGIAVSAAMHEIGKD